MPFDYLHPNRNETFDEHLKSKASDAHVQMIRDRAGLLFRMGYPLEEATRRLQQNVEWDFEMWAKKLPGFYEEIPSIVEDVYRRKPTNR